MLHSLKQQDITNLKSRFFGIKGHEFAEDGDAVLAKETVGKQTKYFCKFNTCGIEAGHLVNPWSMYANESVGLVNALNKHTGKYHHEYKEVSKDTFDLYISYLSSSSDVHYRQAERKVVEDYV